MPKEGDLLKKHFDINNVSDFPLIFLTDERRKHFKQLRNPSRWKKQFGLKEEDITIGVFGMLSAYKNYLHSLRTLNLLPPQYKLLIIGEAHHMNIKEWQVDPVIQEMVTYLDNHPTLADQVVFTGRRDDSKYYEDIANVDFVLLPTFEAGQSSSATLCNALELSCPILKSNNLNTQEYEIYFPDCFEVFDIGNYYETKHKIINFDKTKTANLCKRSELFSEVPLQQMYMNIYETMKACIPINLSSSKTLEHAIHKMNRFDLFSKKIHQSRIIRTLFYRLPRPAQALLRKLKNKLLKK
ncbi:MAG: hypothetical protein ABSA17_09285 [Rhabdochlamydiaceae bacterium]